MRFDPQSNYVDSEDPMVQRVDLVGRSPMAVRQGFMVFAALLATAAVGAIIMTIMVDDHTTAVATLADQEPAPAEPTIVEARDDGGPAIILADDAPRESEPEPARPDFVAGLEALSTGRPADAVPLLLRAIDQDPDFAEARYRLGLAYVYMGNPAQARGELAVLHELDPNLASMLRNLCGES